MGSQISSDDNVKIETGIREKYSKVAKSPEGQFKYPTGKQTFSIHIQISPDLFHFEI